MLLSHTALYTNIKSLTAETISLATSCVIVNGLSVNVVFSLHKQTQMQRLQNTGKREQMYLTAACSQQY